MKKLLIRCSGLHYIMNEGRTITEKQLQTIVEYSNKPKLTENQSKELERLIQLRDNTDLPEAVKTHCIDLWTSYDTGRNEEIKSKYLTKGIDREEDGITMLSLNDKRFYRKNTERLKNNWLTGEPDIFLGESVDKATETFDTKLSWSAHTFNRSKYSELNPVYEWQGHGYMDLTGSQKHSVVYCLTNATAEIITNEKYYLARKFGYLDIDAGRKNQAFIDGLKKIEINHIFDLASFMKEYPHFELEHDVWEHDIPFEKRIHIKTFERDEEKIERIHKQVDKVRNYIFNTFK